MGRPREIEGGETRRLTILCSAQTEHLVKTLAQARGITTSKYLRAMLEAHLRLQGHDAEGGPHAEATVVILTRPPKKIRKSGPKRPKNSRAAR